eukprot:snap_masked-scaffold_3-processed-gene-1.26-mRNA-1 protein AED:1.00 eAED:1.00 QI:0/-1/0/0/-1/1/1/0/99
MKFETGQVTIYSDNIGTVKLMEEQIRSFRTMNMPVKYFFTREVLKREVWKLSHIKGTLNCADISTKPGSPKVYKSVLNQITKTKVALNDLGTRAEHINK